MLWHLWLICYPLLQIPLRWIPPVILSPRTATELSLLVTKGIWLRTAGYENLWDLFYQHITEEDPVEAWWMQRSPSLSIFSSLLQCTTDIHTFLPTLWSQNFIFSMSLAKVKSSFIPPLCINHLPIPNSSCSLAFSLYLPLCLPHPSLSLCLLTQKPKNTVGLPLSIPLSLSLSRVLEDLSKPRGRKSTFLPHQLSKPGVEKAQLEALWLQMLRANANVPFA